MVPPASADPVTDPGSRVGSGVEPGNAWKRVFDRSLAGRQLRPGRFRARGAHTRAIGVHQQSVRMPSPWYLARPSDRNEPWKSPRRSTSTRAARLPPARLSFSRSNLAELLDMRAGCGLWSAPGVTGSAVRLSDGTAKVVASRARVRSAGPAKGADRSHPTLAQVVHRPAHRRVGAVRASAAWSSRRMRSPSWPSESPRSCRSRSVR